MVSKNKLKQTFARVSIVYEIYPHRQVEKAED